jgi:predicted nucleic acid-binding protein
VTLILDTGPLVAHADRRDSRQAAVERLLREEEGELVVPLPVATETDYLLGRRGGRHPRLAFLHDLASGRFVVAGLSTADLDIIQDLERRYAELDAGLADLAIVIVAARHRTDRIATFDDHFRVLRPIDGSAAFTVLP